MEMDNDCIDLVEDDDDISNNNPVSDRNPSAGPFKSGDQKADDSASSNPLQQRPSINPALVQHLFQKAWGEKVRISSEALQLSAEYLRYFVVEAVKRAQYEAALDGEDVSSRACNDSVTNHMKEYRIITYIEQKRGWGIGDLLRISVIFLLFIIIVPLLYSS
mmetsp:Transcript_3260/g.5942  ORF Transcript_3260/g.5942 Transcript_3260/m.5942 type:complete len:162 (+) Transcript_3260:104-589(+)